MSGSQVGSQHCWGWAEPEVLHFCGQEHVRRWLWSFVNFSQAWASGATRAKEYGKAMGVSDNETCLGEGGRGAVCVSEFANTLGLLVKAGAMWPVRACDEGRECRAN